MPVASTIRTRVSALGGGVAYAVLLILFASLTVVSAQVPDSLRQVYDTSYTYSEIRHPELLFGFGAGYGVENYTVEMKGLPGVPSCCPNYTDGSGSALRFSPYIARHIGPSLRLISRLGGAYLEGDFKRVEMETIDGGAGSVIGEIEHTINTSRFLLRFAPGLEYSLFGDAFVSFAVPVDLTFAGSYSQRETLLSPANVRFENDRRIRMERSGSISDLKFITVGIQGGIGYELPVNTERSLSLVPQISYGFDLGERINGTSWRSQGLDFELGLRYHIDREATIITDTILTPRIRDTIVVARDIPIPVDTLPLVRIATEEEQYLDTLGMQIVRTSTLVPLLSHIFFNEGSSEIPPRYHTSSAEQTADFAENRIDGEAFDVYYRVLDILGSRLRRYPEANLTLTGCNTHIGSESNNIILSQNRAEAIRRYLIDVWSIDSSRVSTTARNLPSRPSPTRNEDGRSENRRVELTSSDQRILDPVMTHDTAVRPDRSVLYFEVVNPGQYTAWQVHARQGNRTIMRENGTGSPPQRVPLVLSSGAIVVDLNDEPINFSVDLTDEFGEIHVDSGRILIQRESRIRAGAEAYWMVVFGYDKRTLDDISTKTIGLIRNWLDDRNGFIVELVGQTDRTGNAEYNRKLSVARATGVVEDLGEGEDKMRGVGNAILEYPNDLPEGRYYSRNVKIVTRTDRD